MGGIKHDKKEDNPKYKEIMEAVNKEAEEECKAIMGKMGFCHAFWGAKKRILKEKYNIKWKSPAELNRNVKFD
jgi:hypothetical protein